MATEIKSTSIKSQNIIAEPVANKPASPEQGQIIQANGTGNIAKGIYQYSGSAWMALDNAQGDLETLRLIMSTDTDAVGFSSALNSTSTLAGNTNAIPHETSTGTGMLGALEVPSTGGDALLTEFDANKVFRYYSAGANNNNDYFGIPVDIPAQTRGQNIVIKFKYRTEEASAASSNGDFQVSVWDKSNGVKTTSTDTSTVAAGSNITVASSTGMAVGDKIWLESGGNAVNNVGNSITEAYITEVGSSTAIKITETWTPASTAGSLVVTGWLSSKIEGLLPAADSDTNKVGKDYSIAVKTEEDTEQVVVWFSNKSTTTNVIELFFDGILVSQNKFLQASSQPKTECYLTYNQSTFWSTSTATDQFDKSLLSPGPGSPPLAESKLIQITDVSSDTRIIAREDIELNISAIASMNAGQMLKIYDSDDEMRIGAQTPDGATAASYVNVTETITLAKNDYIYFKTDTKGSQYGAMTITAKAQTSDVILLENQDEIFTAWQEYTPTFTGAASGTDTNIRWRRVGSMMEIQGIYDISTTAGSTWSMTLPSGYAIDTSVGVDSTTYLDGGRYIIDASNAGYHGGVISYLPGETKVYRGNDTLYYGSTTTVNPLTPVNGNAGGAGANPWNLDIRVPIQGWNTNFNPLLSMPLVDVGRDTESIILQDPRISTGTSSQRVYYGNVLDTTDYDGSLFTYDNDSTDGLKITFNQNVDADVNFGVHATSAQWIGIAKNYNSLTAQAIAIPIGNCISFGNTGTANTRQLSFSGKFKAGDYLYFHCNINSTSSDGDRVCFSMAARKDRGNTNMAHIIKPAVAVIQDQKAANTASGEATSGSWLTRDLTVIKGESWFVTLDTNKFTLEPGTYEIFVTAPFYKCENIQLRLYDETNSVATDYGQVQYARSANYGTVTTNLETVKTVTSSTEYKIQYQVGSTMATNGLGAGEQNWGGVMVFTQVKIRKLK